MKILWDIYRYDYDTYEFNDEKNGKKNKAVENKALDEKNTPTDDGDKGE